MADLKSLSNAELDARIAKMQGGSNGVSAPSPPPSASNLSALSNEELDAKIKAAQDSAPVIQEMHPSLTTADRLIVKNFATNNEASVNYLQKAHPDLEIKVDKQNDQILARKRDGSEPGYKVLDPNTGILGAGLGENLRDLGDIGYDALSGIATAAAGAAGGAAGAAAGTPTAGTASVPLAMAGASAASAAAGGGMEALKQFLGKRLGIEQDYSPSDMAVASGAGAISPLLFGTGASAGQLAAKGVTEAAPYITGGIPALIKKAIGPGAKATAEKVAGAVSGMGEDAVKTLVDKPEQVKNLLKDPQGVLKFVEDTGKSIDDKFHKVLNDKWETLANKLDSAGSDVKVDLDPVKQAFREAIKQAEEGATRGTEASKELVGELKDAFQRHFVGSKTVEEKVPVPSGLFDFRGNPLMNETTVEKQVQRQLKEVSPKEALSLSRELSDIAGYRKLKPGQVTGDQFTNQSQVDKELMSLGGKLKSILDEQVDFAVPGISKERKAWGDVRDLERQVDGIIKNPRQAFTNLRNADIMSNQTNKQIFNRVDQVVGTDLGERAKLASTVEQIGAGRKSVFTPTGLKERIPAALGGAALGLGLGGGPTGALIGGAAGNLLAGPKAIQGYIAGGRALGRLGDKMAPMAPQSFGVSQAAAYPWLKMQMEGQK